MIVLNTNVTQIKGSLLNIHIRSVNYIETLIPNQRCTLVYLNEKLMLRKRQEDLSITLLQVDSFLIVLGIPLASGSQKTIYLQVINCNLKGLIIWTERERDSDVLLLLFNFRRCTSAQSQLEVSLSSSFYFKEQLTKKSQLKWPSLVCSGALKILKIQRFYYTAAVQLSANEKSQVPPTM